MRTTLILAGFFLLLASTAGATSHKRFDSRAESDDGGFLQQGEPYEHTFAAAGTYNYHSTPHEHGSGTVASIVVAADATASGRVDVKIQDRKFDPDVLRVKPGTTVVWTNMDPDEHSVTEDFDSPGPDASPTTPTQPPAKDSPMAALAGAFALVFGASLRRRL